MRHRELARCAPSSTHLFWAHYEEPLMRNTVGYFRTGGKDPILLVNSKSLSFSTLIFGPAHERLD
jgi:hypothetical protein